MIMNNSTELKIKALHLEIAAKTWGNPQHKPIVALHGWLDNAGSFDFLAPLIKNRYFIALDLPGHGYSDHLPRGCFYQMADFVLAVMNVTLALHLPRFTLLGHSLGAAIATLAAASFSEKIDKLILIDGIGPLSASPEQGPDRLASAIDSILKRPLKTARFYPDFDTALTIRAKNGHLAESAARPIVMRGIETLADGIRWNFDRKLLLPSPFYLSEEQVHAYLTRINTPTCFIEASRGILAKHPIVQERLTKIKNIQCHEVEGGHHCHLENPTATAMIVNNFLGETDHFGG